MNRKLLYLTTIILTLAGCTSEDYVGDEELKWENEHGKPISLSLVAAPQTRSVGGSEAAGLLNNNFVIYGIKSFDGSATPQVVFNNYQANYGTNTAGTTTSNSNDWEYVGYTNVPDGVTTNVGVTAFSALTAADEDNENGVTQSIKYWDYSAAKYEFFGYSLGKGNEETTPTYATATALTPYTYTLSGTQAQLAGCYISDLLTKTDMNATNTVVQLQFRKMESKVRIALYETIPGYSVKDVKFYQSANATSGTTAYLYDKGTTASLPKNGQYVVTYTPVENPTGSVQTPATITWTAASTDGSKANVSFGVADATNDGDANTWDNWAHRDYKEFSDAEVEANPNVDTLFIGRASNEATISQTQSVLPNPSGTELTLKVDYTLVSRDGYGETIEVKGATATVPAAYAQWQPNCSYTYLFKISDNTNGTTGQNILGLSPITLDAVVNTNVDGKQETITTVSTPSITTYQKGSNVTGMDEYYAGNIYVVVGDGTTTLTSSNAKLYIATIEDGAAQSITESTVANAIENGTKDDPTNPTSWTVTDANDKDLVVTAVATDADDKLAAFTSIPADDAPNGKVITVNGACFAATAGTSMKYYVFEYDTDPTDSDSEKFYKVIKVGPITTYQKGVTSTEEYQAGNIYFWVGDGSTALTVNTDAKLYTVTNVKGSSAADNPVHEINEVSVANVLANGTGSGDSKAITDANGWTMTVTSASGLAAFTTIPAAYSSSDSDDDSKKGVKFTATAGTNYVLEYIDSNSQKYYKVVKVAPAS